MFPAREIVVAYCDVTIHYLLRKTFIEDIIIIISRFVLASRRIALPIEGVLILCVPTHTLTHRHKRSTIQNH
jgi:hypothetical protein